MTRTQRMTGAAWGLLIALALSGCQGEPDAPKPSPPSYNPQAEAVAAQAQDIAAGIERYKTDVGQYPTKLADLAQSSAPGWKGPYVRSGPPAAPTGQVHEAASLLTELWGQPFEYTNEAESPKVISRGPDKQLGTADDIVVSVAPAEPAAPSAAAAEAPGSAEASAPAEPKP